MEGLGCGAAGVGLKGACFDREAVYFVDILELKGGNGF